MYRLIVYREPLEPSEYTQEYQRYDIRMISYKWHSRFPWMPDLEIDDDDEDVYLYWEFPTEADAAIFKLTHL